MTYSVEELIAQKLVARIQTVKRPDYQIDVADVVRPGKKPPSPKHYLVTVEQHDPERDPEHDVHGNPPVKAWWRAFQLNLYVRPSEADQTPIDQLVNMFAAEVIKAIAAPDDWTNWDGLAIDSEFRDPVSFKHDKGDHEGLALFLFVNYRTAENDPYTAR